jgi:hypothetical protein
LAAAKVAALGRDVVLKDPSGQRSAEGGTSDTFVDGVPMDIYTPEANTSARQVLKRAKGKNDQSQGVILNLVKWEGSEDDLGDVLARVQGKAKADGSLVNIQEIIIIH